MADSTIKVYVGAGRRGARLKAAFKTVALEKHSNMSELIISDFCQKYGYDFATGNPTSQKPETQ